MMRELLTVPNDILRTPCKPVVSINSEVKALANDLVSYMTEHRGDKFVPFSLAAPQLGELVRIIVFYPNPAFKDRNAIEVLINPELVKTRKFTILTESCLSIPGKNYLVRRARMVKVKGLSLNDRVKSYKAVDLFAQMLQHEINHLDGVLIDSIGEENTKE